MGFSKFFDGVQKKDAPRPGDKSQEESKSPRNHNHSSAARGEDSNRSPSANKRKHREDEQKPQSALKQANGRRSSTVEVSKKSRPAKRRRGPPSQEALQLSAKLMEFSQQKQLKEALEVYWDEANNAIRDEHHACIMVNCCSRCGDIEAGERIIEMEKSSGSHINIETKTALLKGYCHSGQTQKAMDLFETMSASNGKRDRPNVRTLNTFLRGCLWTASAINLDGSVSGGVISSEKAWVLFRNQEEEMKDGESNGTFDASSYEYATTLLCQALRTEEAVDRIKEFKATFGLDTSDGSGDQSVMESLSICFLNLARAFSLLGRKDDCVHSCQNAVKSVKMSRDLLKGSGIGNSAGGSNEGQNGGKRGWRQPNGDNVDSGSRRSESNVLFRNHRLDGVESDAKVILSFCENGKTLISPRHLARRFLTRVLVLSGGGTTDLSAVHRTVGDKSESEESTNLKERVKSLQHHLVNSSFHSFGLQYALKRMEISIPSDAQVLKRRDCNRILGEVGLQGGVVGADGFIDFARIFSTGLGDEKTRKKGSRKHRYLDIELGAGFGEWVVNQAAGNPSRDHVAVELRADRVGQIFSRTAVFAGSMPLENLCIVGAESGDFLTKCVRKGSVSTIFVNHPEPPTQTFGAGTENLQSIMDGGDEPAHMLNSRMLEAAAHCLFKSKHGRIIIATDNRWYGRLICATFVKVLRQNKGLLCSIDLTGTMEVAESFPSAGDPVINLFEGQPSPEIGHFKTNSTSKQDATGVSYFDRLWRSGAGTHAENKTRFIIAVARVNQSSQNSIS